MKSPKGARWNIHLSNNIDFKLKGTTNGIGAEEAQPVQFSVEPRNKFNSSIEQSTELFVTIESP